MYRCFESENIVVFEAPHASPPYSWRAYVQICQIIDAAQCRVQNTNPNSQDLCPGDQPRGIAGTSAVPILDPRSPMLDPSHYNAFLHLRACYFSALSR